MPIALGMVYHLIWSSLFLFLIHGETIAQKKIVQYNMIKSKKNTILDNLLKNPAVKSSYELCLKKTKTLPDMDVGECVWNELSEQDREEVIKMIPSFHRSDTTTSTNTSSPALAKIETYYKDKLWKLLYPNEPDPEADNKEKRKILAQHTVFYRMYASLLSKNIISAISSYCFDASYQDNLIESEGEIERNRKENLRLLSQKSGDGKATEGYRHWARCAREINKICVEEKGYSKNRACEVVDYIQSARQNLLALKKIENIWKDRHAPDQDGFGGHITTAVNVEEATSLSSREIVEKSGYGDEQAKIVAEAEKCKENFDPQRCAKFVAVREAKIESVSSEYSLVSKALGSKIEKEVKEGEKEVLIQYLKEAGFSDGQIEKMLKNEEDIKSIKEKISRHFAEKRSAVIARIKNRVGENTVTSKENAPSKMVEVHDRLKDEHQRIQEVVFFNNMVSGFLQLKRGGKVVGQNSMALYHELEDSVYGGEEGDGVVNFEEISKIGRELTPAPSKEKGEKSANTLDVESINESLLNYK